MALMRWDDEEKEEESNIKKIASVQSGWQPAPSGANSAVATDDVTNGATGQQQSRLSQNYLFSQEKAQADAQRRQRQAQEAEARRIAAANAAAAAAQQQAARQWQEQQVQQQQQQQPDPNADRERRLNELRAQKEQENKGLSGWFNRNVKDKFDANTVQDRINRLEAQRPEMFQEEQKLIARDNVASVATNPFRRIGEEFIEAPRRVGLGLSANSETGARAQDSRLAEQQAIIDNQLKAVQRIKDPNVSDEVKQRWYNYLVKTSQGDQERLVELAREISKQKNDSDPVAMLAALAEMGVDVATLGLGGKIAAQTAKLGVKGIKGAKLLEPVISGAVGGGLGSVTSQGSDVTPMQIGAGAVAGGGFGALFPAAGGLVGRGARKFASPTPNVSRVADGIVPSVDPPTRGFTPVRNNVAEGVAVPSVGDVPRIPTQDIPFRAGEITPARGVDPVDTPVVKTEPKETPVDTPVVDTPAPTPEPVKAPVVADGAVKPIRTVVDTDNPVLPTQQVKALQDSRAGKSQAEEAVINQKLKELDPDTPAVKKRKIHSEDQGAMRDFIDYQRGVYKPDAKEAQALELEASRIAEYYGLGTPNSTKKLADLFDTRLMEDGFGKKPKELTGAAQQASLAKDLADNSDIPDWQRQRNEGVRYAESIARESELGGRNKSFASEYRKNVEILQNGEKNTAYQVDPKTGKVTTHPASEILEAFSRASGEDLPPLIVGNQPGRGGKRLDNTTGKAFGTYNRGTKRLDYSEKRSVYHETVHHVDLAIKDYKGDNSKMLELQKLRKEITPQEVRRHKLQDAGVKNVEEYVAHAMDLLVDGRIKAGQLGNGVLKYMKAFFTDIKEALTTAAVYQRRDFDAVSYVKQLDRVINEIDDGLKMPKQKPLPEGAKPVSTSNLPPAMGGTPTPGVKTPKAKTPPKPKGFEKMMMKSGDPTGAKKRIAEAVGLGEDAASDLSEILKESGLSAKQAKKITDIYTEIEQIAENNAKYQKQNRKNYKAKKDVDEGINKAKNRDTRREQELQQRLETELKRVKRQGDAGERITQVIENITAGRLANMLSSTGNVSRNLFQEIGADIISTIKNPIKTVRGATKNGNLLKSEGQRSLSGWKNTPTTVSEGYKYILGNTYKTAMTPVSAGQRARVGGMRTELTKWAMKEIEGRDLTSAQAESLSRTLSNHTEALANTLAGVDNGMVSSRQAMKAMKAWKEFVKTGSDSDLLKFENLVERQSTLASKMMKGIFEGDTKKGRVLNAMLSNVFPYVRTAWNLADTGVTRTLNPVSKSVIDQIRADQFGAGKNTVNILKNKLVDYGLLTGAAMLVNDNVIVYNDGDDVDKPRGISLNIPGSDKYIPIRATPIELPLAVVVAAATMADDVASGDVRDPSYYGKIVSGSLPYIDAFEQTTNTIDSVGSVINGSEDGDGGYAATSYGVNAAKSLVPWSNNGIEPQIDAIQGRSTDAKKTYDENPLNWLGNQLNNSYGRGDYLPVSRDAAGRARTKDNQGVIINKTINDESTSEFNDRISDLVDYGRQNGLGDATRDMFNSYDTGENNNFRSIQNSITFLDAPEVDGKTKPDNDTKLQKNEKYTALSQQIRDAFYGGDASELLTLDGKNLYSDVSVPNKNGTKNSSLPISMQSITNAIAATDLPDEERARMYEVSQEIQALYDRRKAKEITYDQEQAMKAELETEYTSILSNSEGYQQLANLIEELDDSGFFEADGLGSTRSGQTYLWNALNSMLGSKGKTPAAQYPKSGSGFTPWGRGGGGGSGLKSTNKPGDRGSQSIKWTPVQARQMAKTKKGTYTPFKASVKLGNAVKKDKTQNYASRSF